MGYLNKDQGEEVAAIYTKRGSPERPSFSFQNAPGTGMYLQGDDQVAFSVAGVEVLVLGSGGLLFDDGTAAAPSISFDADTNTGLYRIGADRLGFTTAGVSAFEIDASGRIASATLLTPVIGAATGTSLALTGRVREGMSITDLDAQNGTMLAAEILGGIYIHTSVTGGGTVTTDTAANIISGIPLNANGETVMVHYINDGTQTVTFAGGTDVTISDTGNTVLTNESAILLFRRTTATTCTCHII